MTDVSVTRHATTRMAQRALHADDLELIMLVGTEVEDGYLVREKDCQAAERYLKRLLDQVRRLRGARVVVDGEQVVTVYRAGSSKKRHLLRTTEERSLDSYGGDRGCRWRGQPEPQVEASAGQRHSFS
ncbi:hypothetical protein EI613_32355 (plasmid) [Azospirillum sp. 412522]|nr:DUF4258 domain-containing protein [Azospirillum sp. 412522]MBY6266542.1 hypothetical protein [Azospirillum sp. 412522]